MQTLNSEYWRFRRHITFVNQLDYVHGMATINLNITHKHKISAMKIPANTLWPMLIRATFRLNCIDHFARALDFNICFGLYIAKANVSNGKKKKKTRAHKFHTLHNRMNQYRSHEHAAEAEEEEEKGGK